MSKSTSEAFFDAVEWAASQPWSSGKVGLLGISYYAGSQWRVAALQPKGLSAIIPWEGMSDYYRDRCRHGGILSDSFIRFWWNRQVVTNQYGRPDRAQRKWGENTIEGDLSEEELLANRNDQNIDNANNFFRDDEYYASKEYNLHDIKVPLLSVANWGGILLHLRGNVVGYMNAGSKLKYLRFITGRHDLPFYYPEEVALQRSFLDAFLKDDDRGGWSTGTAPKVSIVLREGDVGFNNAEAERTYKRREESEWPIARTQYTPFYLTPDNQLLHGPANPPPIEKTVQLSYPALGTLEKHASLHFTTPPFAARTEITGHITAHLCVSMTPSIPTSTSNFNSASTDTATTTDKDIDLFLTFRHLSASGTEIFYTGTAGDPVPLTKGWLRVSLRRTNPAHPSHRPYLPYRDYFRGDVQPVVGGEVYGVDVELWPTNVVVQAGARLVLEVSSGDTQGSGIFTHRGEKDRTEERFGGVNHVVFEEGEAHGNYVTLPIIPEKEA